jgi:predicted MFS family arabinose efflux permease
MTATEPTTARADHLLTRGQWLLLFVLAAIQFAHTVDFVLIMPLAPKLTASVDFGGLGLATRQFGLVVSVYGWAAFASGLVLAPWLDRFDRKHVLLLLFAGFTLGTLLCALSPDYPWLLAGRALAGACGGVAAATILAILGDAIPDYRRGFATGVVMSAFSISSIAGVPAGLLLANAAGWRAPFVALTAGSAALLLLAVFAISPVRGHLRPAGERNPGLWPVLSRPAHLQAFAVMLTLVFGGFLVIPFIADFLVKNVGVTQMQLPLVYVCGGLSSLVTMNVVGRLADRLPRLLLFRVMGTLSVGPIVLLTMLPRDTALPLVLLVTTGMMIFMSARMVPLMAVITGIAPPEERGTFMSLLGSVQQLGAAMGPAAAALLLGETTGEEPLVGYGRAGLASAAVGLLGVLLSALLPRGAGRGGPTLAPEKPKRPCAEASTTG